MEPIDTEFEYVVRERKPSRFTSRNARFNWMLILPALGILWLLYLAGAALFQWPISGVVNPVMSFMIVIFFVLVALLFWAMAPNQHRES